MGLKIIGTGSSVPEKVITNEDLTRIVDTSDEWIVSHTGIKSRHILEEGQSLLPYSVQAAKSALEDAGVEPRELDLILCANIKGDTVTPSTACIIQGEIGAQCPAFDINAACPGFVYALETAEAFIATGRYSKILIVAAEHMSEKVNWQDRATCVLFGDAAGAVVAVPGDNSLGSLLTAKGNPEILDVSDRGEGKPVVHMNGPAVYRFAVTSACREIPKVMKQAGLTSADIDHVILHQANLRIIEAVMDKLDIPKEKYAVNIEEYGNTSASCMPLTLDLMNRSGKLKRGDMIVLCAFGGGLTTGTYILKW